MKAFLVIFVVALAAVATQARTMDRCSLVRPAKAGAAIARATRAKKAFMSNCLNKTV